MSEEADNPSTPPETPAPAPAQKERSDPIRNPQSAIRNPNVGRPEPPKGGTPNMEAPAAPTAWQPFTFPGVAAFAGARYRRLFVVQTLVAVLVAVCVVWFLQHCYAPVITQAIEKLPDGAALTNGHLVGIPTIQISETKFFSIAVATDPDADLDQSSDVQIALRKDHASVSSLFSSALGYLAFYYRPLPNLDLSRTHLEPILGAWRPVIFAAAGLGTVIGLFVLWAILAWIMAPAAKFMAWLGDRELGWLGAWKLAGASMLPGAFLMALGIILYGLQIVDVFGLGWFETVHLMVGGIYLLAAPFFAPRLTPLPSTRNPFAT